ncbi:MAG: hypothetical protein FJ042_08010, partial [Candidatus Cloacimonetes bacterium]|nr:hypothetical protein [Candidatus Cloacimonadota bacterium]
MKPHISARAGIYIRSRLASFDFDRENIPRMNRHTSAKPTVLIRCFMVFILFAGLGILWSQKIPLRRHSGWNPPRQYPYSGMLHSPLSKSDQMRRSSNPNYNRLLVILVDFQEEMPDDPLTTGNGKFLLAPDSTWKTTIGSPPHDRAFFEANMEALRFYYLAVSYGSYDLEFDVWPKDRQAYTLPHSMGYYKPPNATADVFIARMEEYFKVAFETADALDPQIDFGSYGHYMIIHAGSDWQHDV